VLEAPRPGSSPKLAAMGCWGARSWSLFRGRLACPFRDRAGEAACGVAVARDDPPRGRGRRPCRPVDGERGKRPGAARQAFGRIHEFVTVHMDVVEGPTGPSRNCQTTIEERA
jgi:hypothetical protein